MTIERDLKITAIVLMLISAILGLFASKYWYILAGFSAVIVLQSLLAGWCPIMSYLRLAKVSECSRPGTIRRE